MGKRKDSQINQESLKLALGAMVADRVEIQDIRLMETSAKQAIKGSELPTELELGIKTEALVDLAEPQIAVLVSFTLQGRYEDGDAKHLPLRVVAVFCMKYSLSSTKGLEKENYDAFAELNGVFNAWPYWREYVQSVTVRMGLPPLMVPVYRPVRPSSVATIGQTPKKLAKPTRTSEGIGTLKKAKKKN